MHITRAGRADRRHAHCGPGLGRRRRPEHSVYYHSYYSISIGYHLVGSFLWLYYTTVYIGAVVLLHLLQ